jgi:Na+/melibiose symporter-like transporter
MSEAATRAEGAPGPTLVDRRPLTRWQLASYGAPALPLGLASIPIALYLPQIYAGDYGLSLAAVGLLLMLIRITDVVTDPVVGVLSDRVRTRWGRRKPFVLLGTPLYVVAAWFLFFPPFEFSEVTWAGVTFNNGYAWLALMLFLLYLGSTIKNIPYGAWGAELAFNYNERSRVFGWREQFTVSGSLLAAFTPAVILLFGYSAPIDAVWFLMVGMLVLMLPLTINSVIVVPEYPPVERRKEKLGTREMFALVRTNRPYVMLVTIFAVSAIGTQMTNSLSLFFVTHVLLAGQLYGLYLFPYFICQVAALPLWMMLSRRIGKHRATMVAIGWYSLWSLFIPLIAVAPESWFAGFEIPRIAGMFSAALAADAEAYFAGIPTGKFLFFIVIMCLKGSSIGALAALPNAMLADVVDLDSAKSGKQQTGAFFSIWSMVAKSALALGVFIGTGLAAFFGFDPKADPMNTTNTGFALLMLAILYSIVPALFKFVAMPFLWNYPLTEARVQEIQAELDAGIGESTARARSA